MNLLLETLLLKAMEFLWESILWWREAIKFEHDCGKASRAGKTHPIEIDQRFHDDPL